MGREAGEGVALTKSQMWVRKMKRSTEFGVISYMWV